MIYFFYLHTTIRPNYRVLFHFYFFIVRPFDQKLRSSLIYIFHFHTTIQQKYMMTFFLSFLLSLYKTIGPKISVLINLFFCLYMTIRPKLGVALILKLIINSYPYISYTIFIEVLLLYFVRYVHAVWSLSPKPNEEWPHTLSWKWKRSFLYDIFNRI